MSPLSFSTPIFIRKKNMTCAGHLHSLLPTSWDIRLFLPVKRKNLPGGSGSWMESLWKENAVRSVIGNACCRRLRKRGNGVSGFLRPVCCIRDTSIMRRFVWRQNKLHGKPGYHFCTGISGHTGMTGSIFQKNWGCIVRNGVVVF